MGMGMGWGWGWDGDGDGVGWGWNSTISRDTIYTERYELMTLHTKKEYKMRI